MLSWVYHSILFALSLIKMGLSWLNLGYGTWSYFQSLIGMVSPAVNNIYSVLTNPYFLAIILVLVALSLVPSTGK